MAEFPVAFTIEVSDKQGSKLYPVRSAREAIDTIADLLNANFVIVRLSDHNGDTVDYDHIVDVRYPRSR